jgi:hypothetical protein
MAISPIEAEIADTLGVPKAPRWTDGGQGLAVSASPRETPQTPTHVRHQLVNTRV